MDKMQDKQFTVEGLVGDDPKVPFTYIGEYLLAQHTTNAEKFDTLDALTSKTKETLS